MKKRTIIHLFILALLVLTSPLAVAGMAGAQADSSTIQSSSGYVDDNGDPISMEEYEAIRKDRTGIQWDNIALVVGGVVVIAAAVTVVIVVSKKRKHASDINTQPLPTAPTVQDPNNQQPPIPPAGGTQQ